MSLKEFYEHIDFDINKKRYTPFRAKQGDTDSRGFYVQVKHDGQAASLTDRTMTASFKSARNEPFDIEGVLEEGKFRIDIPNGVFDAPGIAKGELVLRDSSGGAIADDTFSIDIEKSIRLADTGGVQPSKFELLESRVTELEQGVTSEFETIKIPTVIINPGFKEGLSRWESTHAEEFSFENGLVKFSGDLGSARVFQALTSVEYSEGDILYSYATVKSSSSQTTIRNLALNKNASGGFITDKHSGSNEFEFMSIYGDANLPDGKGQVQIQPIELFLPIYIEGINVINLTKVYGKGKEPSEVEIRSLVMEAEDKYAETLIIKRLIEEGPEEPPIVSVEFPYLIAGSEEYPTIQSALDALPNNGGKVYVKPGIYEESLISTKPNTILEGTYDAVIKQPANGIKGENDTILRVFGKGTVVRNLKFLGNPTENPNLDNHTDAVTADGIAVFADYCKIQDNWLIDIMGHSIIVWNDAYKNHSTKKARRHINIEGNLIEGNGHRTRIDIAREGTDEEINRHINIINNHIRNTDQFPILLHGGFDINISNNHIENIDNVGIRIHNKCKNIIISENIIRNTRGAGIFLNGYATVYENFRVINNIIDNTEHMGITVVDAEDVALIGNYINNTELRSIDISGSPKTLIKDNRTTGAKGEIHPCVRIGTSEYSMIKDNIMSDKHSGVRSDSNNIEITGNLMSDMHRGVDVRSAQDNTVINHNTFSNLQIGVNVATEITNAMIVGNKFEGSVTTPVRLPEKLLGEPIVSLNRGYSPGQ